VWATEPEIPIRKEATLEELYADVTAQPRFFLVLLGSFAGVALLLSAVGVLASLGQHVRLRTRELGVRRALGADAGSLFRQTLGDGLRLGLIGTGLGVALAWVIARLLGARVVGVSGWSPFAQLVAAVTLVVAAVLAAVPPALRAVRVDPMDALRSD